MVRADVDYYSVLGVEKNADKKAIKAAYRWRALLFPWKLDLWSVCAALSAAALVDTMLRTVQHASGDSTTS